MASSSASALKGIRRASHASSWYSDSAPELSAQLEGWLQNAATEGPSHTPARAIIAPHAGYSYCGECGGFAYKQVDPLRISRIFILGPSHHVYLPDCALTAQREYETPLGNLRIDDACVAELHKTGAFKTMSQEVDEDEHSIEMHLPYIKKVLGDRDVPIVPVLVGSLSVASEARYGKIFAPYLEDPANLFVVSSDFCHWGKRFSFQYTNPSCGSIHESIEQLDREGMSLIEGQDADGFAAYLKKYGNTICGRHPIAVLLRAMEENKTKERADMKFLKYAQSSQCRKASDSSVSYASASLVFRQTTDL